MINDRFCWAKFASAFAKALGVLSNACAQTAATAAPTTVARIHVNQAEAILF
jgi:hypothetical protein